MYVQGKRARTRRVEWLCEGSLGVGDPNVTSRKAYQKLRHHIGAKKDIPES